MNNIYTISHREWTEVENDVTYPTDLKFLLTMPLMGGRSGVVLFPTSESAKEFLGPWRKSPAFTVVTFRSDERMIEQLQELANDANSNRHSVLFNYQSGGTFTAILSISDFIKRISSREGPTSGRILEEFS